MPNYGDVIYNPYQAYAAPLLAGNVYGLPSLVDYLGTITYEYESDNDELMSAGMVVETLSIPKKITGEIDQGSLDYITWAIMTGFGASEYSTTPNRYYRTTVKLGGEGLPYFGLIVAYAAIGGANLLCGFPKVKLDTVPGFDAEQNKFRLGKANFSGMAISQVNRGAAIYQKNETAKNVPSTAALFLDYFTQPTTVMS